METDSGPLPERWQQAQSVEHEYWRTHKHPEDREFWQRVLKSGFDLNLDFFANKDVLEVGPGPCGMIYALTKARSRIGIEPMDMSGFIEEWKNSFVQKGVGEALPFDDEYFDIVICFNVLDHCEKPSLVMRESWRVLRKGGIMLLWVHTLRNPYRILQRLLNRLDRPHPYHFTRYQVIEMVKKHFTIQWEKWVKGAGLAGQAKTYGNLKVALANYVTESLTMRLVRATAS